MRKLLLHFLGLENLWPLLHNLKESIDSERTVRVRSFNSWEAYCKKLEDRVYMLEELERQKNKVCDYAVRFKKRDGSELVVYFKDKLDALLLARTVSGELEYTDKKHGVRIRRDPSYGLDEFEEE